jgi:hypothetical protein
MIFKIKVYASTKKASRTISEPTSNQPTFFQNNQLKPSFKSFLKLHIGDVQIGIRIGNQSTKPTCLNKKVTRISSPESIDHRIHSP